FRPLGSILSRYRQIRAPGFWRFSRDNGARSHVTILANLPWVRRRQPRGADEPPGLASLAPAASDRWFRSLAETTEIAILVYRETLLYVNPACEHLTGYSAAELIGAPITLLVHPDFQAAVVERTRRRLAGDVVDRHFELKVVRRDGSEIWVQVSATRVETDGEPAGLLSALDITDRKLAVMTLEDNRARLELAQRVARMVTWEWNLATDELLFLGEASEVLGGRADQIWRTGTAFLEAIHPDDQRAFSAELGRCVRSGGDFFVEFRILCPDGVTRRFTERGRALPDESGVARRLIGVSSDVTSARLAAEELSRERGRAEVTLASIGDGVIRTDPEGRIDYLNPVAERLIGWTSAEAHGQPALHVLNLADERGRPIGFDPIATCLSENRVVELPGSAILIRRDGVEFAVQDSVAPIRDAAGQIAGTVLVFKDVTGLRR